MPSFVDNHDGFVLSNARFNPTVQPPSCSGLLTPPESPRSSTAPLPMPISTQKPSPTSYRDSAKHQDSPQSFRFGLSETELQHDLSHASETIYTIIEQVIEQKLAEAMGPLRLNIRRFDSENEDLGCQVGHIEQHLGHLEQQLHTLQSISVTASSNLELLSSLANQLSKATNIVQKANQFAPAPSIPMLASPASRRQENHFNIHPQFCFEPRSSKQYRQSRMKARKPGLVNYMLSKWRTGGARD